MLLKCSADGERWRKKKSNAGDSYEKAEQDEQNRK